VSSDPAFELHDPRKAKRWSEALAYFEASPRGPSPRFGSAEVEDRGRREQRLRLWERYASLGNRDAARALGDWYADPIDGSAPDPERALRAYRVAAAGGDAAAIVGLVRGLNAAGASAAQRTEARTWLRQGAVLGDPALQAELGRQLARERGKRRVDGAAYLLAAARAEEKGALDDAVALLMRMSRRDVDAALRRSRELASEY
jgi:TPR repeat protein